MLSYLCHVQRSPVDWWLIPRTRVLACEVKESLEMEEAAVGEPVYEEGGVTARRLFFELKDSSSIETLCLPCCGGIITVPNSMKTQMELECFHVPRRHTCFCSCRCQPHIVVLA